MKDLRSNVVYEAYVSISYPFYVQIQSLMLTYVESLLNILVSFSKKKTHTKKTFVMYMIIFFEFFKTILPLVFAAHFASV